VNTKDVANALQYQGYAVVRDFLSDTDIPVTLLKFLEGAAKFSDGVIKDIPPTEMRDIQARIERAIPPIADLMGLSINKDRYVYCAIRIEEAHGAPVLRQPFDMHRDPKVAPGGVLNWHLDHFSYYQYGDHRNWLICYLPVIKLRPDAANLAIVPSNVIRDLDSDLHSRIQGRGAMRFRCAEVDTLDWFRLRFGDQNPSVGDWYAVDDYDDSTMGWKINLDLEKHKVVPELHVRDLLIMRADTIHRTNDAGSSRISVRCDAMPSHAHKLDTLAGLLGMTVRYPFMGRKRRYNLRNWLRWEWAKKMNGRRLSREKPVSGR
jgi:hypothetical protein